MKTLQQELIDFLQWMLQNEPIIVGFNIEDIVDRYLKSINSNSAGERRAIGSNEAKRKLCWQCGKYETTKGDGTVEPLCEC